MIELLTMFLVLGVLAWAVGIVLSSMLSRWSCEPQSPDRRIRRTTLVALLPWLLPVTWIASLGAVAAGKRAGWLDDHCRAHGDGHPHLCFEHFPAFQVDPLAAAALLLVLAVLAVTAVRHLMAALGRRRRLNGLLRLLPTGGLMRRIEDRRSMALVARPLRPVLLISRGLLEGLDRRERRVVVAHEAAHLRQGDLVKSSLFEWLLTVHWPAMAKRLRANWRQAIEERADDRVALRFGRSITAQVLLKVVRQQHFPATAGLSAGGANVAFRVERLLDDGGRASAAADWAAVALGVMALASAWPLAGAHHAMETFLGAILGA